MEDDDLDALLDDALESYDQAKQDEDERQEKRKLKESQAGSEQDELTALLEKTLTSLQENGGDEDKDLQELVQQGIGLMKDDGSQNEGDMFRKCLGLLDTVTKEMGKETRGTEDDSATTITPFVQQLQKTLGDVIKGMEDGSKDGDGAAPEDQTQLLDIISRLSATANTASSSAPGDAAAATDKEAGAMPESLLQLLNDSAVGGDSQFANMIRKEVENSLTSGETPEEAIKSLHEDLQKMDDSELNPEMRELLLNMVGDLQKTAPKTEEAQSDKAAAAEPAASSTDAPADAK
ncbi:hypothetical protein DIPPA_16836 [Diplonema papillatum]|nr:hypothetical protein DIPPA_16836 [Diplonema papillatum]